MNLHNKAQHYILERIKSGEWPVDSQIPPEAELSRTLGISRPTLRQALARLSDRGYLSRQKGRGTFVTEPKLLHASTSMIWSYGEESARQGRKLKTEVLALEQVRPEGAVADALKLGPGKKVTRLTRLRRLEGFNGGRPVLLTSVFVPVSLFPRMAELDFTDTSFYAELEKEGLEIAVAERELEAAVASPETAELLEISRFEPVIRVSSVGFLTDGRPVEYAESYYPAGCSKFMVRVNR